ncbi:MAG: hypothetical protein ACFCUI_14065 [Bernardetiaceae bacterium]
MLQTHTVYDHQNVTITYLPDRACLVLDWNGEVDMNTYQSALEACLEYARAEGVRYFLVDQVRLKQVPPEAQGWLVTHWFPAMEAASDALLFFAIVPSQRLYARIASNKTAHQVRQSSEKSKVHYFRDVAAAQAWLTEQASEKIKSNAGA